MRVHLLFADADYDPPITEAEIAYLEEVRTHASSILPVLSKVDLVSGADRSDMVDYCRRVLERIGISEPIIPVSVLPGGGITADPAAESIGVLRDHIRTLDAAIRRAGLEDALARKTWGTVTQLQFQNDLALAALNAPIESLRRKVAMLSDAATTLKAEQSLIIDHIAAEVGRLHQDLDAESARLREQIMRDLLKVVEESRADDHASLFTQLAARVGEIFPLAFNHAANRERRQLERIANRAMDRVRPLLVRARETAADVMGIEVRTPEAIVRFAAPTELGWRQRPAESMSPLPPGFLDRFLPAAARRRTLRRAMRREAARLALINTEHLRWTLRQVCDDALRAFGSEVETELASAIASVAELADTILQLREDKQDDAQAELGRRTAWAGLLIEAANALRHAHAGTGVRSGTYGETDPAADL